MAWLLSNWRLVATIGGALALMAYIKYADYRIGSLTYDNKVLEESIIYMSREHEFAVKIGNDNADELIAFKKSSKKLMDLVQENHKKEVVYLKKTQSKITEVKNGSENDDGNVSNVLVDTFKWLRTERVQAENNSTN